MAKPMFFYTGIYDNVADADACLLYTSDAADE